MPKLKVKKSFQFLWDFSALDRIFLSARENVWFSRRYRRWTSDHWIYIKMYIYCLKLFKNLRELNIKSTTTNITYNERIHWIECWAFTNAKQNPITNRSIEKDEKGKKIIIQWIHFNMPDAAVCSCVYVCVCMPQSNFSRYWIYFVFVSARQSTIKTYQSQSQFKSLILLFSHASAFIGICMCLCLSYIRSVCHFVSISFSVYCLFWHFVRTDST